MATPEQIREARAILETCPHLDRSRNDNSFGYHYQTCKDCGQQFMIPTGELPKEGEPLDNKYRTER